MARTCDFMSQNPASMATDAEYNRTGATPEKVARYLHRRHLIPSQAAMCAARAREIYERQADGDQTGIHAIPALQSAASVTAVFSPVLYSQTSGQGWRLAACNIRNCATHAAAMEFVLELAAILSPPVQSEGTLIQLDNMSASSRSNHLQHYASTHFAGSNQ